MAEGKADAGARTFAEFVQNAPLADEAAATVVLTGAVLRSATEGKFVLVAEGYGQLELDIDAVRAFDILEDSATRKWGRVVIGQDRITKALAKDIGGDTIRFKDVAKDPITDQVVKQVALDPPNTLVENVDPSQLGVIPEAFGGAAPFIMATPHHAPEQALRMQAAAAGVPIDKVIADPPQKVIAKEAVTDNITDVKLQWKDIRTDPVTDVKNTIKDIRTDPVTDVKLNVKDVSTDPITDVTKNLVADPNTGIGDTLVENVGTLQEGGGTVAEGGFPGQGGVGPAGNPGF
ncbi:MAG TPA: hypothetical protein VLJ59_14220 [Mycobacteriales bacterium]|nr:hypothetical protein [Mycobacteriales bacterium]